MRRVVTGRDDAGKSVFLMDGQPPRSTEFENLPGLHFHELWATDPPARLPAVGEDPTVGLQRFVAPEGGTRFRILRFPPDAAFGERLSRGVTTLEQFGAEFARLMPDLAETLELHQPGMHTTNTVDYNIVLDGEICCELDDGAEVRLSAGDVLVQCGTRHAWRNRSGKDCLLASVMVGVSRSNDSSA